MDARDLSAFSNDQFDAAIFLGFVEIPMDGRADCLREAYRVLRPGGAFIYSAHSYYGLLRGKSPRRLARQNIFRLLTGNPYLKHAKKSGALLEIHHSTPAKERRTMEAFGFEIVAQFNRKRFEHWPFYVARKM